MHARNEPGDGAAARGGQRALWLVGTSVSIEDGGYATHLHRAAEPAGWALRNLSVGDQTSIMGWMRLMQHVASLHAGDVVVWEYSLLDQLLPQGCHAVEQARTARRLAWAEIARRGLGLVVALTPPGHGTEALHAVERDYVADAATLGAAVVDLRDVAAGLGIRDLAACYRDDRHPGTGTSLLPTFATAILAACERAAPLAQPHWMDLPAWSWLGAAALAAGRSLAEYRNTLMHVAAVPLAPDESVPLPEGAQVVAVGIVSARDSGALWCGHPGCPPASTRLPPDLHFRFLLRASGMACRRPPPEQLACAPQWTFQCGQWRDYGQETCATAAGIAVFGAIVVLPPGPSRAARLLGSLRRAVGARPPDR